MREAADATRPVWNKGGKLPSWVPGELNRLAYLLLKCTDHDGADWSSLNTTTQKRVWATIGVDATYLTDLAMVRIDRRRSSGDIPEILRPLKEGTAEERAAWNLHVAQTRTAREKAALVAFSAVRDDVQFKVDAIARAAEQPWWAEGLERPPAPAARDGIVTPREAEEDACVWMKHFGIYDTVITRYTSDGGKDGDSSAAVASVKHQANPVGCHPVREIAGVAAAEGKAALFFTKFGYTKDARKFADAAGVALLVYDSAAATIKGVNTAGRVFIDKGIQGFTDRNSGLTA